MQMTFQKTSAVEAWFSWHHSAENLDFKNFYEMWVGCFVHNSEQNSRVSCYRGQNFGHQFLEINECQNGEHNLNT